MTVFPKVGNYVMALSSLKVLWQENILKISMVKVLLIIKYTCFDGRVHKYAALEYTCLLVFCSD